MKFEEFIKRLKEEMNKWMHGCNTDIIIDKLAEEYLKGVEE